MNTLGNKIKTTIRSQKTRQLSEGNRNLGGKFEKVRIDELT